MPGRVLERKKRRLPCSIRNQSQRFSGMVVELSATGLFLQTRARVDLGDDLELEVSVPCRAEPISLTVSVVREKRVPARLRSVAQGGIGTRILAAPEAFYEYLLSLDPEVDEAAREPDRSFQICARQMGGPRTRRLFMTADDLEDARAEATRHLGADWEILEASEVHRA